MWNPMQRPLAQWPLSRLLAVLLLCLALTLSLVGCSEQPTPTPPPVPTARPTSTPSATQALESSYFSLSFNDQLLAFEELRVGESEGQLLIFSEVSWLPTARSASSAADGYALVERRSVVVSADLTPQRYDVERSALGVRSVWIGERDGETLNVLNNNLDWHAPVFQEGIAPAPDVLIEEAPSALPYALLALRYTSLSQDVKRQPQLLHTTDIMEDLVASRAMTLTVDALSQGGVLGTTALQGVVAGSLNSTFLLSVRPASRALYSVEVEDYRFDVWSARRDPRLREAGRLVIQRLGERPEVPAPPSPGEAPRVAITFTGARNTELAGTLILPEGDGPFPCLMLHSQGGVMPRWDPGDVYANRGWAVFAYDKRGLGESEGEFDRGILDVQAEDAVAAAAMLSARPEIDPQRLVLVGLGKGGQVGALAAATTSDYAAAVLGSAAFDGPLFPDLFEAQVRGALATYYGWNAIEIGRYEDLSIARWRQWLFEGQEEVTFLGRRAGLGALRAEADINLYDALSQAQVPVLLLHGTEDRWAPVESAHGLAQRLQEAGQERVALQVFEGLGADLGAPTADDQEPGIWSGEVDAAVFSWLEDALPN